MEWRNWGDGSEGGDWLTSGEELLPDAALSGGRSHLRLSTPSSPLDPLSQTRSLPGGTGPLLIVLLVLVPSAPAIPSTLLEFCPVCPLQRNNPRFAQPPDQNQLIVGLFVLLINGRLRR